MLHRDSQSEAFVPAVDLALGYSRADRKFLDGAPAAKPMPVLVPLPQPEEAAEKLDLPQNFRPRPMPAAGEWHPILVYPLAEGAEGGVQPLLCFGAVPAGLGSMLEHSTGEVRTYTP